MKFRVNGAHRESGKDICVMVEAADQDAALQICNHKGILVSQIKLVSAAPPAPAAPTAPPPEPAVDDLVPLPEAPMPVAVRAPARLRAAAPGMLKDSWLRQPTFWVAALVLIIGGGWIAWATLGGGSSAASAYSRYIPDDAAMIGYFNVQRLKKSELYSDTKGLLEARLAELPAQTSQMKTEELAELFIAAKDLQDAAVVFRTLQDRAVADVLPQAKAASMPLAGLELWRMPDQSCGVKLDKGLFAMARDENGLQQLIGRHKGGGSGRMSADMLDALNAVKGEDHCLVLGSALKKFMPGGSAPDFKAMGIGFSVGSSISLRLSISFTDPNQAKAIVSQFDQARSQLKKQQAMLPAGVASIIDGIHCSQSHDTVKFRASAKYAELKPLVTAAASALPSTAGPMRRKGRTPPAPTPLP
jgi:hypothetical protein